MQINQTKDDGFENKMAKQNNSIIKIKNISDEDFSHSYAGHPYTIEAGETLDFPYPVGIHLAKHLSMKLAREKVLYKGEDKNRKAVNMYTGDALKPFLSQIIIQTTAQEMPVKKDEGQVMKEKTEKIQREMKNKATTEAADVTKKDIIDELKKRKVKFNPRANKDELLDLLIDAEQRGITGEEE